jgi:hypothetical protein
MKIKMKPSEKEGKRTFEQNLDEIMEKLDGLNVQKCMFPEEYDDIDSESDSNFSDYDMDLHDGEAEYDYVLSVISLVKKSIAYLKRTTTPLNGVCKMKIRRFFKKFFNKMRIYSKAIFFNPEHPEYSDLNEYQRGVFREICDCHHQLYTILSTKYQKTNFLKAELLSVYTLIQKYLVSIRGFIDNVVE